MGGMANIMRLLWLGLIACPLLAQSSADTLALRGTLIMPDGIVENGTVLIQQGKIVAAGTKVKAPANATTIDTHGIIAPGLIDLHNHLQCVSSLAPD
jgi:5-methylthioadenosine/S-adenosylhomocysteine deaminase